MDTQHTDTCAICGAPATEGAPCTPAWVPPTLCEDCKLLAERMAEQLTEASKRMYENGKQHPADFYVFGWHIRSE